MTRKRAKIKSKKTLKKSLVKNKNKVLVVFILALIVAISSLVIALNNPSEEGTNDINNSTNGKEPIGKWLFAMDTANIQYMYSASGIPTLVVIDPEGDVIYYSQGAHSKDQLLPYIESAVQGTAESLGQSIDFTVTTFNNEKFTLSEHKGEVVLLDIMGVGCPPCEMQMPELQKIKKEYGEDITILSVDVYYSGETKEDVIETYGEYIKE